MKTYTLFLFKISSVGIYIGFSGVLEFLKSAKNSSFWAFFNSPVTASWISATSAERGLLTSFSTWGRETSLSEINLQIQVEMKSCLCQKLTKTCRFVSGRIIVQKEKSRDIMRLHDPYKCASEGDQLIHYKILQLLFFLCGTNYIYTMP